MVQTFSDVVSQSQSLIVSSIVSKALDINPHFRSIPLLTANNRLTNRRLKEDTKPQMETRAFNAQYPTKQKATFKPSEVHLKPHGATFTMDRKYKMNDTVTGMNNLQMQMDSFATSLLQDLPYFMFNGNEATSDGSEFNGYKAFLSDIYPSRASVYDEGAGNTNGIQITDAAALIDNMDELVEDGPDFIYMPRELMHKINSTFANGQNSVIASKYRKDWIMDPVTGDRQHYGAMYEGIPIIYPGDNSQGSQIIGMNETLGASNITGSMYAVKYGENFSYMLQDEAPEITEYEDASGYNVVFDWLLALDIANEKGIRAKIGFLV